MTEPRPYCYVCRHPRVLCLCADVTPVATRTRVIFLQHSDEAWNQIGTARLAHLSLPGSLLLEGVDFAGDPRLAAALGDGSGVVLLYPTPDAVPVSDLPSPPHTIVVVDGTWAQAKQVVKGTPELGRLVRVRLDPGERSRYRIRLQPKPECVSTIEAAVRALAGLEGDEARFTPLLEAFDRMVDRHVKRAAAVGRSVIPDWKARWARKPLPPALALRDRHLYVHGETLWRGRAEDPVDRRSDLVQWAAFRPATGERFEGLVRLERPLSPQESVYLELDSAALATAVAPDVFRERWRAFLRADDVALSWGYFATNVLQALAGPLPLQLDLRGATKGVIERRVRRPEDALDELGAPPPPPLGQGRCGRRLAAVRGVVEALLGLRAARRV